MLFGASILPLLVLCIYTYFPVLSSDLPQGWSRHNTPEGKTYYYNRDRKQSSWEKPAVQVIPTSRSPAFDLNSRQIYSQYGAQNVMIPGTDRGLRQGIASSTVSRVASSFAQAASNLRLNGESPYQESEKWIQEIHRLRTHLNTSLSEKEDLLNKTSRKEKEIGSLTEEVKSVDEFNYLV